MKVKKAIRTSVAERVNEIRHLKAGWFEGGGTAFDAAALDWLVEMIEKHCHTDKLDTYIYPHPSGLINLEWNTTMFMPTAEVDLGSKIAIMEWNSVGSFDGGEEILDLKGEAGWKEMMRILGWLVHAETFCI